MPPASLRSDSDYTSRSSPKLLVSQTLPPHASRSSPPPASFRSFLQEHAFLPVQAFQLSETVRGFWPLRAASKLPLPLRPALPPGHLPLPSINELCLVLDHHSRVGVRLGDQTSFTLLFGLPAVSSASALAFASASPLSPPPPPPPSLPPPPPAGTETSGVLSLPLSQVSCSSSSSRSRLRRDPGPPMARLLSSASRCFAGTRDSITREISKSRYESQ